MNESLIAPKTLKLFYFTFLKNTPPPLPGYKLNFILLANRFAYLYRKINQAKSTVKLN